ncbi:MAG: hypothetical protein ABWZ78_06440 [Burkholderiaceae bacterium]
MGMFSDFKMGAATRRRRAQLQRMLADRPARRDDVAFDEFGAPEGGFGRVDGLLTELRAAGLGVNTVEPA